MTIRHFKIFVSVCEAMNMTMAAESLYMSQSAVSQAVAELEKHYDVRLFERLSRKLYLTQAGEKLLMYAQHMVRMNADIEKDMKSLHETGLIRLGASVTVGATVLPALVSTFRQANPSVDIEAYEDNTKQIQKRLLMDKTDIGIVEGEITSQDILSTPFMNDELVLICSNNHRFADLSVISPDEVEKEDFILREHGSGTRKTFEDVMTAHQLSWKVTWICNNTDTIKAAVIAGLGISVISKRAVEKEMESGALIVKPIEGVRFFRTFKIAYHKNKYITAQMKKIIDLCIALYPEETY
ncbi:LysR family transcriptional regulator [Parasporobacterium paucivorans]|uniref:DNA-binding transcriptional regulator, LysR family n=1 Tax=Parasporobacterium paucivorans DSM 15970 TaxID=1122934 RepID=A0A1M6K0W9_9FIRM|nr:LysR family transcriptional regulator [Parasporobacterium paucivorans]SHJ52567.1 DNA-binding transcriptional regulator, LysR family [Parasporobacterium paucivorans DSM 15970]